MLYVGEPLVETMSQSGIVALWILGCLNRIGQVADDERSLKYRGLERISVLCKASSFWLGRLSMAGVGSFRSLAYVPVLRSS